MEHISTFPVGNCISSEIGVRRWLELLAEPRKDSGQIRPVVLSNRHHHLPIWLRLWPDKQNSSTNLYRHRWATSISNLEAEMNPYRPVIKTSSVPSLHYSIRQMSLWTQTLGFKPSSPSSPYYLLHVQMKTRRFLQPSNSAAQLAYGGIIFTLCSLPIMLSPGMSSGLPFKRTIYPRDSLSASSMNF
jgi:hypothetical protein